MRGIKARVRLASLTPMSQTRYHGTPKLDKEDHQPYEDRTWREKMHADAEGNVITSQFALMNTMKNAASYAPIKIPGGRNATYTKIIRSSVSVATPMVLLKPGTKTPLKKAEIPPLTLIVPLQPNGKPGIGPRGPKHFPLIEAWEGVAEFFITDATLPESVFIETLENAGKYIGLGSLRVGNGGVFGKFEVKNHTWKVVGE
jgi:hypothetical protein